MRTCHTQLAPTETVLGTKLAPLASAALVPAPQNEKGEDTVHRSEAEMLIPCADCGAETTPALERGFGIASDLVLCFDCARQRGGRWDEELARWSIEPDLMGLRPTAEPEER